jgi:hypothetical protein
MTTATTQPIGIEILTPANQYLFTHHNGCENLLEKAAEVFAIANSMAKVSISYHPSAFGESYYVRMFSHTEGGWDKYREIRISDHDCGTIRMQEQMQVRSYSTVCAEAIEMFLFPDRFEMVSELIRESVVIHALPVEDFVSGEVIEHFTSKKGKPMVRFSYIKREYRKYWVKKTLS